MMKSSTNEPAPAPTFPPEPSPPAQRIGLETVPQAVLPREIGGRDGPEPTRFGDWEKAGRCIDF